MLLSGAGSRELEPVAGTGASQDWTGFTTLLVMDLFKLNLFEK